MPGHDIIVIGASAGGVETLMRLIGALPPDLPAAVFVVLHVTPHATSALPDILARSGPLPALHPVDGAAIRMGQVYVAPPDHHLLVEVGHVRVVRGPYENNHRPAVDPLFRTAARAYGPRVTGVVLLGMLDDGTSGLQAVKLRGGVAVVQDPADALFPGMPRSAVENVAVDWVLPLTGIAPMLALLAREGAVEEEDEAVSKSLNLESNIADFDLGAVEDDERPGRPSPSRVPSAAMCCGSYRMTS